MNQMVDLTMDCNHVCIIWIATMFEGYASDTFLHGWPHQMQRVDPAFY